MSEYIDREDLTKHLYILYNRLCEKSPHFCYGFLTAVDYVKEFSAADVAPVVHSYWESYDCNQYMGTDEYGEPKWRDGRYYVCHNYKCRRKTVIKTNYCPNCGAMMDGDADNGKTDV